MAKDGVAALSLAEVARRMDLRPPSLYQYFSSKLAIYDALFEQGARLTRAVVEEHLPGLGHDPLGAISAAQDALFAWVLANPVLAQLLYWRPVPGFEPSPPAFEPAVRQSDLLRTALRAAVDAGQLAPAAASEEGVAMYTVLISGVISQQLSNEPSASADRGRFTRLGGTALDMFIHYYAPPGKR